MKYFLILLLMSFSFVTHADLQCDSLSMYVAEDATKTDILNNLTDAQVGNDELTYEDISRAAAIGDPEWLEIKSHIDTSMSIIKVESISVSQAEDSCIVRVLIRGPYDSDVIDVEVTMPQDRYIVRFL